MTASATPRLRPLGLGELLDQTIRLYRRNFLTLIGLQAVLPGSSVVKARQMVKEVIVEDGILAYIARIAEASRRSPDLTLGASTRAATHVLLAAKTYAVLQGRAFVTPDDVKFVTPPVYRHRILLKPEAEIEGLNADAVIQRLLSQVEVPR